MAHAFFAERFDITAGNVLTAGATVFIGWVIQRALRRETELNKVPIDTISRTCGRVESLVHDAAGKPEGTLGRDPALLTTLSNLLREAEWLERLAASFGIADAAERLTDAVLRLDQDLTRGEHVNLQAASRTARDVRVELMRLQWQLCQRITDQQPNLAED